LKLEFIASFIPELELILNSTPDLEFTLRSNCRITGWCVMK